MAIKMRVLYNSKKKGMGQFAQAIASKYELPINATSGKFPPEYPCDKERIVILMFSLKGEPSDVVRRFCGELNKTRANNVALVVDGNEAAAKRMKEILTAAGTNVVDEVFYVKTSFLSFLDKITPEEKDALLAWTHKVVDGLQ